MPAPRKVGNCAFWQQGLLLQSAGAFQKLPAALALREQHLCNLPLRQQDMTDSFAIKLGKKGPIKTQSRTMMLARRCTTLQS
jgi:hypothetical protein